MSTYQIVIQVSPAVRELRLGAALWKWWLSLYADPPRTLRPMI